MLQAKLCSDAQISSAGDVLSGTGALVAHYRKIHLFDVDVPNGPVLLESRTTLAGDKLVVCESPVGRLALTVCYDLRFPEMWQRLAFDMGAQAIAVPSAFTKTTGLQFKAFGHMLAEFGMSAFNLLRLVFCFTALLGQQGQLSEETHQGICAAFFWGN